MAKATKKSRPGSRRERKYEAWCPLRRPALLAALGLAGWAPAGAVAFPASIELASLDGTNGFRITGAAPGDRSGFAVSGAGDVNGDGIAGLLIGAYGADPNGNRSGASHVVFGRALPASFPATLDLSTLNGTNGFRIEGVATEDQSGRSVSAAGDVNGDGIADFLIGAPAPFGADSVSYVVFGRAPPASFPGSLKLSSLDGMNGFRVAHDDDEAGHGVSAAGDVNGDGIADLLIDSFLGDRDGPNRASYVVFGKNTAQSGSFPANLDLSALDGTDGFGIAGVNLNLSSFHGAVVSGAGDVNGDGIADLLIGDADADPNDISSAGVSYVIFGRAPPGRFLASFDVSSLDGTNGFRINGVAIFDDSGRAVSDAGDVNGDGVADILIANGVGVSFGAGASYVVLGQNTSQSGSFPANLNLSTLDGTNGFRVAGVALEDGSGRAVSGAGDMNGDGTADLLIGAPFADPNGTSSGASYVIFGEPSTAPSPAPGLTCNGLPVTLAGTPGNDTLSGTPGSDVVHGMDGNDLIRGLGGNDVLCGGAGRDRLFGGPGRDRLFGEKGRDALNGGSGRDRCDGGRGTDTARRCEVRVRVP